MRQALVKYELPTGDLIQTITDSTGQYIIENIPLSVRSETNTNKHLITVSNNGASQHWIVVSGNSISQNVSIYSILGRKIAHINLVNLLNENLSYGYWDGKNESGHLVANGLYFIQVNLNGQRFTERILHLNSKDRSTPDLSKVLSIHKNRPKKHPIIQETNTIVNVTIQPTFEGGKFRERIRFPRELSAGNNLVTDSVELPLPNRVLLIGNSYTYYNGGIEQHFRNFTISAIPSFQSIVGAITGGGMTLQMHYQNQNTRDSIIRGRFDYVVLQEQSTRPIDDSLAFYTYVQMLDSIITFSGAKTALFMTWGRANRPQMIDTLSQRYYSAANRVNALVVPVGIAFQTSLSRSPNWTLHETDDSHPNQFGTYLAVCTFFAKLHNLNPIGTLYVSHPTIPSEQRLFFQQVAWDVVTTSP